MRGRISVIIAGLALCFVSAVRADLVISVGSISLASGSSGYVPVYISSTTPIGSGGDSIASTGFKFQITNSNGDFPGAQLQFAANPPLPGSDPTYTDNHYIFYGNSGNQNSNSAMFGTPLDSLPQKNGIISGGDSTADFGNVVLSTTSPQTLLTYIPVTAAPVSSSAPSAGDTYSINLVNDPSIVQFFDAVGNQLTVDFGDSTGGTVTITPAVAAPLPRPVIAAVLLLGLAAVALRFQRRGSVA